MKNKLDGELIVALAIVAGACAIGVYKNAKSRITKYFKNKKLQTIRNRIEAEFQRWKKITNDVKGDREAMKTTFMSTVDTDLKSALEYLINSDIADGH